MDSKQFEEAMSYAFEWLMGEGILIFIILTSLVIGFAFLKRGLKRLQTFFEGNFPDPSQIQRASTLTNVLGDLIRVVFIVLGLITILSHLGYRPWSIFSCSRGWRHCYWFWRPKFGERCDFRILHFVRKPNPRG